MKINRAINKAASPTSRPVTANDITEFSALASLQYKVSYQSPSLPFKYTPPPIRNIAFPPDPLMASKALNVKGKGF